MTVEELKIAIENLEESLSISKDSVFGVHAACLASVCENYKELLRYKEQSLGLSPVEVGDTLYLIPEDQYLNEDDIVMCYSVESIEITKNAILLKYDTYDSIICDLESLLNNTPYEGHRVFKNESEALSELQLAKKRCGFN